MAFGDPPEKSVEVCCLHCGLKSETKDMRPRDFCGITMWYCPIESCDGSGYMVDLWPRDTSTGEKLFKAYENNTYGENQ